MAKHLQLHSFTGNTDHDFTGLVSGQSIIFNGTNLVSTGSTSTSGDLWSASTGTDSIIANNGTGNLASGKYAIAGGYGGRATGDYALTLASADSLASGNYSIVLGGINGSATTYSSVMIGAANGMVSGSYSIIGGSNSSFITSNYSAILGGRNNRVSGNYSFIGGGRYNSATTTYSAVVGGKGNVASGLNSLVAGGRTNLVSGNNSSILGGTGNTASGNHSSILGGISNKVTSAYSSVLGGKLNIITGGTYGYNTIVGGGYTGNENKIFDSSWSTIGGGYNNYIKGSSYSSLMGGTGNYMTGSYRTIIGGGRDHTVIKSNHSVIAGGQGNRIEYAGAFSFPLNAFIGAGKSNTVNATYSSIVGGYNNTISGSSNYSSIVGGLNNIVKHDNSHIIGSNITSVSANTTHVEKLNIKTLNGTTAITPLALDANGQVVGGASLSGSSASLWSASTGTNSIIANNGSGNLASGNFSFAGGYANTSSASNSFVGAGGANKSIGNYSFIGNGWGNSASTGTYCVVVNGQYNVSKFGAAVVAGSGNKAYGTLSFIGNGNGNYTLNEYTTIAGGLTNSATTQYSTVAGGRNNIASGFASIIAGGNENVVSGTGSFAVGAANTVTGNASSAIGSSSVVSHNGSHAIGSNITSVSANTTHVEKLNIKTLNGTVAVTSLALDANGQVVDGSALSGITGTGTDNTVPLWNGTGSIDDSIITQQGTSTITVSGDVTISGNYTGETMALEEVGRGTNTLILGTQTTTKRSGIVFNDKNTTPSKIYDRQDGTHNNGLTLQSRDSIFKFLSSAGSTSTAEIQAGKLSQVRTISGAPQVALIIQGGTAPNDANDGIRFQTADATGVFSTRFELEGNSSTPYAYFTNISGLGINNITPSEALDVTGNIKSSAGITGDTVHAESFFTMAPYTDGSPASPTDNDLWMHSAATGSVTINYRIGGVTYNVELA